MRHVAWLAAIAFAWIATPAAAADMAECEAWIKEDLAHLEENASPGSAFKEEATGRLFQAFAECREGNLESRADYDAWLKGQMMDMDIESAMVAPEDLAQCDAWFFESIDQIERDVMRTSKRKSEARVMLINAYNRCIAGDLTSRDDYDEWLRDQLFEIVFERVGN